MPLLQLSNKFSASAIRKVIFCVDSQIMRRMFENRCWLEIERGVCRGGELVCVGDQTHGFRNQDVATEASHTVSLSLVYVSVHRSTSKFYPRFCL